MSLNPSQISFLIKDKNFKIAEKSIIEFIEYNVLPSSRLLVAQSNVSNALIAVSDNRKNENITLEKICNEYVVVISELFCHPKYRPSIDITGSFLTYKFVVDWLFSTSIWRTTDAIIEHLNLAQVDRFGQIKINTDQQKITLLLALITLGSKFKLPWKLLFKLNPAIALSSYIGLVTQSIPALSEETNKGFNYLLESAKDLPLLDLPVITDLGKLNYGFFNCSYATSSHKYEFKKWLTALIRHNLEQWLDEDIKQYMSNMSVVKIKANKQPRIAVMLEVYSRNHAMDRCFNGLLSALSKNFQLIGFINDDEADGADLSLFDKIVTFKEVYAINDNAKLVTQENPDIVFYPSIGMKFWGIYLSQLRLAPLQIMMGGHPSSSYSPAIDNFLILGNTFAVAELQTFLNEKIFVGNKTFKEVTTHTLHSSLTPEFLAEHNIFLQDDTEIRIGINGILTKVTNETLKVCKRIQQGSVKKLKFIFFSGHKSNQLAYLAAKKLLSRELQSFELVCFDDYITYMKTISQCHFLLPTLPFGGANSNIDAMVLNKPKLYIRGKAQIYTLTDQWEWERVDLDEELGCNSIDELVEKSIQLSDDFTYREELHQLLVEKCTIERITGKGNDQENMVNQVFVNMIDHHLKKSTSIG